MTQTLQTLTVNKRLTQINVKTFYAGIAEWIAVAAHGNFSAQKAATGIANVSEAT